MLLVIVEILRDLEIEMVLEGGDPGVTAGPLAAVRAEILVLPDEVLELGCALGIGPTHLHQFVLGRDVHQGVAELAVAVEVLVGLAHRVGEAGARVTLVGQRDVGAEAAVHRGDIGRHGVDMVRAVEEGIGQLVRRVGIHRVVVFPVGVSHGRRSVIDGEGVAEGVGSHQVEAPVEMLVHLGAQRVSVALGGRGEGDDVGISAANLGIIRSDAVFVGSTDGRIHAIDGILAFDRQVLEEDIIHRLGENGVEGEFPAHPEILVETEIGAQDLGIFEVFVERIDDGAGSGSGDDTRLDDVLIGIARQGQSGVRSLDRLGLHAGIVVGVGQPDERHAARENTHAAAEQGLVGVIDEEAETESRGEERPGLRYDADVFVVVAGEIGRIEFVIGRGLVEQHRQVDPDAIGEGEVARRFPLVLGISAQFQGIGCRLPAEVTTCEERIRVSELVLAVFVFEEIRQRPESIIAVGGLQEEVVETEELVVRAEGDIVLASKDGQVVGQGIGVAGHRVGAGGIIRTQTEENLVADIHRSTLVGHITMVADDHRRGPQFVGQPVGQAGVQFCHESIGPVGLEIG